MFNKDELDSVNRKLAKIENKSNRKIADASMLFDSVTFDTISSELRKLKANEPTSDNEFFRLAIINYELGDLNRAIVYAHRFKDSDKVLFRDGFKEKSVVLGEGKLAMADLLTQLNMLCFSLGWDFNELRKLGAEHLKERQKDFNRDGWSEVK